MAEARQQPQEWAQLAPLTMEEARKAGAAQARAWFQRQRRVEVRARDGQLEKLQEATRSWLYLELFVDGRYSSHTTSDLRVETLVPFIREAVAATRFLTADPHRALPPDERCRDYPQTDLELVDPAIRALTPQQRRDRVLGLVELARQATGQPLISAASSWEDVDSQSLLVLSTGAQTTAARTEAWSSVEVNVTDPAGRRPEGWWYTGATRLAELEADRVLADRAAQRAISQIGARPLPTSRTTVLVDAVVAGTLLHHLLRALDGQLIQQERSFLGKRRGELVGSKLLRLDDEPLLLRGLGSRVSDAEGMVARSLPLITEGRLHNFFLDTTYARKLGLPPTTGSGSNVVLHPGQRSRDQLISAVDRGILITSFLGGNANSTTGDFSLGICGRQIVGGRLGDPFASSNLSGNQLTLWQNLVEVGADLFTSSTTRRPSLLFRELQVSGT